MRNPPPGAQPGPEVQRSNPAIRRYEGPEYRRLLAAARSSLERTGGALAGRVSVRDPDDAERKAVIGITGVHISAGTKRMTVMLATLDAAVRRGAGCGLAELLAALGGPLRDRPAETSSLATARGELVSIVSASHLYETSTWFRDWLGDMRRDGTLTRMAPQPEILRQAVRVLEYLSAGRAASTAAPIALPALAVRVTGDTKALNHGTALATVVLRALALNAGTARPESAAERRELWDQAGVVVDDLASRVLVLDVAAEGDGLGAWITSAARYGTPFQVTLHQLTAQAPPEAVTTPSRPVGQRLHASLALVLSNSSIPVTRMMLGWRSTEVTTVIAGHRSGAGKRGPLAQVARADLDRDERLDPPGRPISAARPNRTGSLTSSRNRQMTLVSGSSP